MGFNGSGTFVRLRNWVADAAANIKIRADYHDSEDDGFAAGLSNCICKDGQTTITQNIPFNSKRIINLADAVNAQDAATKTQVDAVSSAKVAKAGDTMTGNLTVSKASPAITLSKAAAGQSVLIGGYNVNNARWTIELGDGVAESGSNAGSNFNINAYNDAGSYIATPMQISRATGGVAFSGVIYPSSIVVAHGGQLGAINNTQGLAYDPTNALIVENGSAPCQTLNRNGSNGTIVSLLQAAATCGSIGVANGNSASFNTSSDGRLKDDLRPFNPGPIIDQLKVYDFRWINSQTRAHGVIAQEAEKVYPAAIFHDPETDSWGADYSKFVPLLLQEIQNLRARVATLEAQ